MCKIILYYIGDGVLGTGDNGISIDGIFSGGLGKVCCDEGVVILMVVMECQVWGSG